jgi:hypothetical protein
MCRVQSKVRRPQIMAQNPAIKLMQVGSQLGEEWRSMSEWDKAPYNEKAAQSKALYGRQMEQYRYRATDTTYVPEVIPTKPKKKIKDPNAPKRPVSAFLEYVRIQCLSHMARVVHCAMPLTSLCSVRGYLTSLPPSLLR